MLAFTSDSSILSELVESAHRYRTRNANTQRYRQMLWQSPGYDPGTFDTFAAFGWTGVLVPEAHGGLGLGVAEMAALVSELSYGLLAEPLQIVSTAWAPILLTQLGQSPLAHELMSGVASGTLRISLAWQEGDSIDAPTLTALQRQGRIWRLDGRKDYMFGELEPNALVTARLDDGQLALVCIRSGAAGLKVQQERRLDGGFSTSMTMTNVEVDEQSVLGTLASEQWEASFDILVVLHACELVALAHATLDMTLDYMRIREQFGRKIGAFQALQHKAVDLHLQIQLARAVVEDAVRSFSADATRAEQKSLASRAKARASDTALRVARESVQLHGAIGYTDEHDVGLYLKRIMTLAAHLGGAAIHRRRFAAGLDEAA